MTLLFVLLVLASARITRLVVSDDITESARTWVRRHATTRPRRFVSDLVGCPWCLGLHVSALLVFLAWFDGCSLPLPLLWPWAVAGGQMLVNGLDLRLDSH